MKRIDMTVDFKSEVAAVFKVITNLKDCSWRSDLTRVEQIGAQLAGNASGIIYIVDL